MAWGKRAALTGCCAVIAGFLAAPMPAMGHSSLVQVGPAALGTAGPSAIIGGTRWPGRGVVRITYFNGSSAKWPVKQAVRAWNSSGARVRFVPAPRRRAQVLITNQKGPASDSFTSGFASVGYVYPGGGYVQLSRLEHPRRPHYTMAGVATHELGHVLGLAHEDRRCATMNTSLWAACRGARPCRLLERDDIAGAVKLYGGRARLSRPAFCPKPPSSIQVTPAPNRYEVALEWRNPSGPFFDRVQIARARGKCPERGAAGAGVGNGRAGATGRLVDRDFASGTRLVTGRYCYALWSVGGPNMASTRTTVWVNFGPSRPAAPGDLRAAVGAGGMVSLSWTLPAHPEFESVEGAGALGRCPTSTANEDYVFYGTGATADPVALSGAGRYCFVAWTRDSLGALIGPSEPVWVDYRGAPPTADFSEYTTFLTADFYDQSYDPDGDEIVSRRWEFGDGTTVTTAEPGVSHTYADPGTYLVRLTVTDSNGLSGTTTHDVTVHQPESGTEEGFAY